MRSKTLEQSLSVLKHAYQSFDYHSFFRSIRYFIKNIFNSSEYDVVFVTHNHFNRGKAKENQFLSPFIAACENHDINYMIFEDASIAGTFSMYPRNENAIPMDFIKFIQMLLRQLFSKNILDPVKYKEYYEKEIFISKVVGFLFFRKFKSKIYLLLAYNNVELWRTINKDSIIIDYQHGMIWNGHDTTLVNSIPSKIRVYNNIVSMVYGQGFKQLLIQNDDTHFYCDKNVIDVGYYLPISMVEKRSNNKVILYTLQNVDLKSNLEYYNMIKNLIYSNKEYLYKNGYKVLIKNHPRYNRNEKLTFEEFLPFVSFVEDNVLLSDIIDKVSIHITSKSTTTFDLALNRIPTIFTDMLAIRSPRDMFVNQYIYPFENFIINDVKQLEGILRDLENDSFYNEISIAVYKWSRSFYQDFDENKFLDLLKINK